MSDPKADAEFSAEKIKARWYVNQNDLIGGWCVGTVEGSASEVRAAGDVADMVITKEIGAHIVACHNAHEELLDVLKDMTDMGAVAMRILMQHGLVDEFVAEAQREGILPGVGARAHAVIARAEKP